MSRRVMNELHVFETGRGPDVVLLHGLPTPPAELEAVASELHGYRVLVPHLPGYGRSAPGRHTVAAVTDALLAALHACSVHRPTLVGYSMGAYRALALAQALAARSVLALAGFANLSPDERAGMAGFAALLRAETDVRSLLPARFLSDAGRTPEAARAVQRWVDAAAPATLIEELEDVAVAPSLLDVVAALACPVVARTGALDLAAPWTHAESIAATAPHGALEVVPGVGHALFLEDRAGTLDAIRRAASAP